MRDWSESAPASRRGLFPATPTASVLEKRRHALACASNPPADALQTIWAAKSSPLAADTPSLGTACFEVARWAERREHTQTAVEWAEIAAILDPENPKFANLAGRLNRNENDYERAEIWFKRGVAFAREQDDRVELIRAHLGYGRLCTEIGQLRDARTHLNTGSRLAKKHGPPSLAAEAQHDLCALLISHGHYEEAEKRARAALWLYGKTHHRLPYFGGDMALLFVLEGDYLNAARILPTVVRLIQQPSVRTAMVALNARALAGAGRADDAVVARSRALKMLAKHDGLEPLTRWHLADSARLAGDWQWADAEASRALEAAVAANDAETAKHTAKLIDQIKVRAPALPRPIRSDAQFRQFLRALRERLSTWSPRRTRTWRPPWNEWAA